MSSRATAAEIGEGFESAKTEQDPPEATTPSTEQAKGRINIKPEDLKNGLAQLVLALINLVHELLEKQAIRRIDAGHLSEEACERIGLALMKQAEEIERLRKAFGLEEKDLNLDLGPLGKLRKM
jgi:Gas vesicle protein K